MDEPVNRQVVLRRLPDGALEIGDFELREAPVPRPGPGEVLCRTVLASPDPVHRLHMRGASYRGSLRPGDVMAGFTLCRVVDPNGTGVETGTLVTCEAGWQDYAVMPVHHLLPVRGGGELTHHMSVLGVTGLTAYFGLIDVGRPRPGETVVVSAAAGATGNVAGQLARIAGARVVGVTGSTEKRQLLEEVLGFEATVDHRSPTFARDLSTACPDGIDVYFDNVGGHVLDAALMRMRQHGRVVCCGALAQYDDDVPPTGPRAVPGLVVSQRLRLEGFVVLDHVARWPQAQDALAALVESGRLHVLEEVVDGLGSAPQAFLDVLAGRNVGKRMVRVERA